MIDDALRLTLRHHAETGHLVPIVHDGEYVGMCNSRYVGDVPLVAPLPVADFIVGLEVLGFAFDVHEAKPGEPMLLRSEPEWPLPASWKALAHEIMATFGQERGQEGIAFLWALEEARP